MKACENYCHYSIGELDITSLFKDSTHLAWAKGNLSHERITDKIFLALNFELTQKYSVSKSQHC